MRCFLCPHHCKITGGYTGICRVRRNIKGTLIAETWGRLSAIHNDPVEKKPLYHFFPGSSILSIGSIGCNMKCRCCQNWQISQVSVQENSFSDKYEPDEVVALAVKEPGNIGIAFTYNEPGIWFEYMMAIARLVKERGLKNVMVSNGYLNKDPLDELVGYIDAFNIDLKGFTADFYRSFTGATLDPVLQNLRRIRSSGRHLEVTCLIIPGSNDNIGDFKRMISWIADELGSTTVLHLSRYHPAYRLGVEATPPESMEKLLESAREKLSYVYAGNIRLKDYQDTRCHNCHHVVIKRAGYITDRTAVSDRGLCIHCGTQVIIC